VREIKLNIKKRELYVAYTTLIIVILLFVLSLLVISIDTSIDNELANQYASILHFENDKISK
jgi:hypothetical protein